MVGVCLARTISSVSWRFLHSVEFSNLTRAALSNLPHEKCKRNRISCFNHDYCSTLGLECKTKKRQRKSPETKVMKPRQGNCTIQDSDTDPLKMYASTANHSKKVPIGGPGTLLPFWLESCLSWIFAISCLGVALHHWIQQIFGSLLPPFLFSTTQRPALPLTTHSRYEIKNASGLERYQQLIQYLQQTKSYSKPVDEWTDAEWIETIQADLVARRLVSLIRIQQNDIPTNLHSFLRQLERIWDNLLQLPSLPLVSYPFHISIVTSAYREDGRELVAKLQRAFEMAIDPTSIELIVIDAGNCTQLDLVATLPFAKVTTIKGKGGGRGPSLNQGAAQAQGRILSFLHADTRVSKGWDMAVRNAFVDPATTACAFSFAIDTTPQGLLGGSFPPGIKAIEATANWRTQLFHLPYGDQCISLPKVYFEHFGGYPHQCLMEDYELVRLLRHRVVDTHKERLAILPLKAYCGPRRWQAFGVLYVTYTNSRCVNLYASEKLTPDDLFQIYYGVPPQSSTGNTDRKSPWEVELQQQISTWDRKEQ